MTVDVSLQRNAWLDGFFREITCTDDGVPKINHKIICIIKYRLFLGNVHLPKSSRNSDG